MMSAEYCEIHYKVKEEIQQVFQPIFDTYSNSERLESDERKFKSDIEALGLDVTYLLSYPFYDCSFRKFGDDQFVMHFSSTGLYWDEVVFPLLNQIGCKDIFAFVHDSSWGGDIFARFNPDNSATEYLYMSQRDNDLDSFLYDEQGDYIGTSFEQLYGMYIEEKLSVINFNEPDCSNNLSSGEVAQELISSQDNFIWLKSLIFLVSLSYLIWVFFIK